MGWPYCQIEPDAPAFRQLAEALANRFMGVVVDASELARFAARYPELRFYAHRRDPERIAFALWDLHRIRQMWLAPAPWWYGPLRTGWNFAHHFTGCARLPRRGSPWRAMEVIFFAEPQPDPAFVDFICAEAFARECHFVNMARGVNGLSPTFEITGPTQVTRTHYVVASLAGEPPLPPADGGMPLYFDLAFV